MSKQQDFINNPSDFKLICSVCGKSFIPESYKQYDNLMKKSRKYNRGFYCSDECRKSKKITNIHNLTCLHCGKEYYSKKGIKSLDIPHFCSQSCAASYNNKHLHNDEIIYCFYCGKEFLSKRNRKYCSLDCQHKDILKHNAELIEQGLNVTHRIMRRYLLDKYGKCMNDSCKWNWNGDNNPQLELHHIDGNHNNNVLSNCVLLCPNCHSLTDNYKFKNAHKSTRDRRKYNK